MFLLLITLWPFLLLDFPPKLTFQKFEKVIRVAVVGCADLVRDYTNLPIF